MCNSRKYESQETSKRKKKSGKSHHNETNPEGGRILEADDQDVCSLFDVCREVGIANVGSLICEVVSNWNRPTAAGPSRIAYCILQAQAHEFTRHVPEILDSAVVAHKVAT